MPTLAPIVSPFASSGGNITTSSTSSFVAVASAPRQSSPPPVITKPTTMTTAPWARPPAVFPQSKKPTTVIAIPWARNLPPALTKPLVAAAAYAQGIASPSQGGTLQPKVNVNANTGKLSGSATTGRTLSPTNSTSGKLYNNGRPYTDSNGNRWFWDRGRGLWVSRSGGREMTKPDPARLTQGQKDRLAAIRAEQQKQMANYQAFIAAGGQRPGARTVLPKSWTPEQRASWKATHPWANVVGASAAAPAATTEAGGYEFVDPFGGLPYVETVDESGRMKQTPIVEPEAETPFYMSWWFLGGLAVVVAGGGYAYYKRKKSAAAAK